MTWERRYRWRQTVRTSLVLWAGLSLVAAIPCSLAVRRIDLETGWKVLNYSPDGARALLGTLVGSMLTFIVFVLSATLIVVQLASGQLTPRIISLVLATPGVKVALGALTFTYAYTLSALARIEAQVPDLNVSLAVLLNLGCIILFFQFVQRLSTGLRPASVMRLVADQARHVIAEVYPTTYDPREPEGTVGGALPTAQAVVVPYSGRAGVLMAFGVADLVRLAKDADAVIELVPQVGDFVADGDPVFRVHGGARPVLPAALSGCFAVGIERTLAQDPRFAFRILVDIANKALSPAINDPTTAVLALDQIDALLLDLGRRRLDEGLARDADGAVRLIYGTPDWPDFVMLGVSEIRQFGEGSLQVDRRLRALLGHLIDVLTEDRHPPLKAEMNLLGRGVERRFEDAEDRRRAQVADFQGIGGSES
jgi:uncharacterized membrane protein